MKYPLSYLFAAASLLISGAVNASDTPAIQFGAYGNLLLHPKTNDSNVATLMVVPEFKFPLASGITLDVEIGLEYDDDADSDFDPEADIEEAALSIAWNEKFRTRIGKMHLPVGVYNLYHEPIYYHSVFPSDVEQKIIPDEWHENGMIAAYRFGGGEVWGGVFGGLSQKGMSGSEWIRGTSLEGELNRPKSLAGVIRYDYGDIDKGVLIGGSIYRSGMSGIDTVGKSSATLYELHLRKAFENGIKVALLGARGDTTKTTELSSVLGEVIGKKSQGWYIDLAYDVTQSIHSSGAVALPVFFRYERLDTQADVSRGLKRDPANNKTVTTVGLNYALSSHVVFKADYQFRHNAGGGEENRIEFGAGFVY